MDKCLRDVANQAQEETFAHAHDIATVTASPDALQSAVHRGRAGWNGKEWHQNKHKESTSHGSRKSTGAAVSGLQWRNIEGSGES